MKKSKYNFWYSKDDYDYNLKFKLHPEDPKPQRIFFVESLTGEVHPLSQTLSMKINEGIVNKEKAIYVRMSEVGGHKIDLESMTIYNLMNNTRRRILLHGPNLKQTQNTQGRVVYSRFHWMEQINGKWRPLQLSFSDHIERCYQDKQSVVEFSWQQFRFIVDLKRMTLQNTDTREFTHIRRQNLYEPREQDIPEIQSKSHWQYKVTDWISYDQVDCIALEKAYQQYLSKGTNNVFIIRNGEKYYIDFDRLIELSTVTKQRRQIRKL